MSKPVTRKSYEPIVLHLQQQIMRGELKVGDKLPPERELSEIHSISRNSVREALRTLEVVGLIECRHGDGNFIANRLDGCAINALSAMFVLNKGSMLELLQMRRSIELGAIRNIIERGRKTDLARLRAIIAEYETEIDAEKYAALDELFHKTLVDLSENTLYKLVFDMLSALILPDMRNIVSLAVASETNLILYDEHRHLLAAIEQGNIKQADAILTEHLLLSDPRHPALVKHIAADLSFIQD